MGDEKTVVGHEIPPILVSATTENPPAIATTTSEEDRHTKSQRRVNLIWEFTQAMIALSVVFGVLFVSGKIALMALSSEPSERAMSLATTAFVLLSNLASLVIGFYFGRTNHQKIGGVQIGR
jgi:hypothetical protein